MLAGSVGPRVTERASFGRWDGSRSAREKLGFLVGYRGVSLVTGPINKPKIDGSLILNSGGISIPYLNVDYNFDENTKVDLIDQSFVFSDAGFTSSLA